MNANDLDIVRRALRRHDGVTLCPDWAASEQRALTSALDRLRVDLLLERMLRTGESCENGSERSR